MNKYYAACCILLSLQAIHSLHSAEVDKWDAEKYKKNSSIQEHFGQYALSQIKIKEDDWVYDLGCGNGKNTHSIAQLVGKKGHVVGIDLSPDMIDQANLDYKRTNLGFIVEDMSSFNRTFPADVVTALCSISWVEDQEKVYKNIARALCSGGRFVGLVSDKDCSFMQAYYKAFTYPKWENYFKNYKPSYYPSDKETIEKHLRAAGLRPLEVKQADIPVMTMDEESFTKVLAATPGVKDAIPQELYMDFMKDVVVEYLKFVPKDEAGKVKIDSGLLLIIAQKP